MKTTTYLASALLVTSLAGTAFAQDSGAYGVIGATTYDFDNHGLDAKLGYNFNRYFGVEAQGVIGLNSDSELLSNAPNSATITTKVKHTVGGFAVARLPLSEQFDIFARAGIHNTRVNFKINNALNSNFNADETGFAGGGGIQYKLSPKTAIRAEYTYLDEAGGDTVSFGLVRKF